MDGQSYVLTVFSPGVSLDGQRISLSLKTLWSFSTPPSLRPGLIHSLAVDPPLPTPYPRLPPLHWPGLHLSSLSAHFIYSSKRFSSTRTPLPHKPLHLVKALLQPPHQRKCSAMIFSLSVFSLLPEPLASLAHTGPSGPFITISASSVGTTTAQPEAPHTAELN